ncbi:RNase adapter RapZ [Oceanimonas sp. NS1]|uniref:RNase adaptor protein RapZ n=1 Tax=Oceanimonas doudoroffii TaxID=84158 RepID=A0A233RCR7_9GAMM|nr:MULTISPECIES: RNase adapter RapZ [Oceanimonas]MCT7654891.1 RNase adapter RapZ [Oceanimonas sp. NS1]NHI01156.1 RNase adapter protein RapZ [Oceanimonas sp. MB9]OXY81196.1 RNase adaptor protein RapZ [Oceanimonas doudoroffii]
MQLVIVSGRSGSGKTVALRVLEDLGHYCVDNLPVALLPELVRLRRDKPGAVAVSIDVRNLPDSAEQLEAFLAEVRAMDDVQPSSIFIDADNSVLIRRFGDTRRLHPLSRHSLTLDEAIREETHLLAPLSSDADLRIDTSSLSIHDLSEIIRERILGKKEKELNWVFESFGYKYGVSKDADFVFDARFLPNPHWIAELRPFTGQDQPVADYLSSQPEVMKYLWQLENLLITWMPHLERNNRSYVTVAIGCTGGQHRSVFIAEQLARVFGQMGKSVQLRHRTLEKRNAEN